MYEGYAWRRSNNYCPSGEAGPRYAGVARDRDPILCEVGGYLVLAAAELCRGGDPCGEMACATIWGKLWTTMLACGAEATRNDPTPAPPWWTDFL